MVGRQHHYLLDCIHSLHGVKSEHHDDRCSSCLPPFGTTIEVAEMMGLAGFLSWFRVVALAASSLAPFGLHA